MDAVKIYSRDVISFALLLSVCFRSLRLVMDPHLPPQIVAADASLLQILDHCFPSFLCKCLSSQVSTSGIFSPHLPVGERPLPLAGSGLVFGLDDHDPPLGGAQLAPVDSCKQEQILTGCSFTFIE